MEKKLIAIDVDDVIAPCVAEAIQVVNRESDAGLHVDMITDWKMTELTDAQRNLMYGVFARPAFFQAQRPYPGAVDAVYQLVSRGHDVVFLSAAEPVNCTVRAEFLMRTFPFIPAQNIILTARKDLVAADILIDDAVHNLEMSPAKIKIMMERPWNKSYRAQYPSRYQSVRSLREFAAMMPQFEREIDRRI